jgi:hypothetical protein
MVYVHGDCPPDASNITALLFANAVWERDWGGETIFFEEDGEALYAVAPTPGRVVLFRGKNGTETNMPNKNWGATGDIPFYDNL